MSHTHGRQADIASAREPEEYGENAQTCNAASDIQPYTQDANEAQEQGGYHGIEATHFIGNVARYASTENAARVKHGQQLIREGEGDPISEGVRGNVGQGHEKSPFEKVHPRCRQCKGDIPEDAEIRPDVSASFGWKPCAYKEICDDKEDEKYESEKADRPGEADLWEKGLEG